MYTVQSSSVRQQHSTKGRGVRHPLSIDVIYRPLNKRTSIILLFEVFNLEFPYDLKLNPAHATNTLPLLIVILPKFQAIVLCMIFEMHSNKFLIK